MAAQENVLSAQPFYPNKPSFSCPAKNSHSLPLPPHSTKNPPKSPRNKSLLAYSAPLYYT